MVAGLAPGLEDGGCRGPGRRWVEALAGEEGAAWAAAWRAGEVLTIQPGWLRFQSTLRRLFFFSPEALQSGRGRRPPTKTRQAGAPNAGQKKDKDESAKHRCQGRSLEFWRRQRTRPH
jgi:hypothetical protein